MTTWDIKNARGAKEAGARIGREGMSKAVIKAVDEFDGSYKGAMELAGKLKAVAQAARSDQYWQEKVDDGYMKMLYDLRNASQPK